MQPYKWKAHRNEDSSLGILRNIGEVQEAGKAAGQAVVADVEDMHQDLTVRKLQRLELQTGRPQRASVPHPANRTCAVLCTYERYSMSVRPHTFVSSHRYTFLMRNL